MRWDIVATIPVAEGPLGKGEHGRIYLSGVLSARSLPADRDADRDTVADIADRTNRSVTCSVLDRSSWGGGNC